MMSFSRKRTNTVRLTKPVYCIIILQFQKHSLETSLRIGREYGEMMVERNKALQQAKARKDRSSSAKRVNSRVKANQKRS